MSFSAIRSIAGSALSASQLSMQISSSNIANADTAGYSRKSVTQVATVTGVLGSGVAITGIGSTVDKYLLASLMSAASTLGAATTNADFANSLQARLGSTGSGSSSGTSLATTITSLQSALASLAGTPESETLKGLALTALDAVATQLRETSATVQGLRSDADHQIEDSVGSVNTALNQIAVLNKQIVAARARGDSSADLEDQRNTALATITGLMDVSYYVTSGGEMRIATTSGTTLLDSHVHELSYSAAAVATSDTVFSAITVDGKDVTGEVRSGSIAALIEQRDKTLPSTQAELDALAVNLMAALNGLTNSGTAAPAPATLTGTATVSATDAFAGTGTARIAVVDEGGALVSYADLDLSSFATTQDFVDALNAIPGLSASISSTGKLTVAATASGQGVAIADIDSTVGGKGLSAYFGLNDVVTGTGASDITLRKGLDSTQLPISRLDTSSSLTAGQPALVTSSELSQSLADLFSTARSFGTAGSIAAGNSSFADYAGRIVGNAASRYSTAQSTLSVRQSAYDTLSSSMTSSTGVNLDEETARITELEQLYSTAAQLLQVLNTMFEALISAVRS